MSGMYAPDDTLAWLIGQIEAMPDVNRILELGSGQSTAKLSRAIAGREGALLLSVEENPDYARDTVINLESAHLLNVAFVAYYPLADRTLAGETCRSYGFPVFETCLDFQVLFVDGPSTGGLARARAVLDARPLLAKGCLIVLDDANREDEQRCIAALSKHGVIWMDPIPTERGLAAGAWA